MLRALKGTSVLVVEDDPALLEMFTMALGAVGADVRGVASAELALVELQSWRPSVVLCDLNLPGIDGYDLLHHLRTEPALARIPVISISGSHPSMAGERSRAAGFDTHLIKPTPFKHLVETIATTVSVAAS